MQNLIPHPRSTLVHIFDGPCYITNEKYMKNVIGIMFFHLFLIFRVGGSIESMEHGSPWMRN